MISYLCGDVRDWWNLFLNTLFWPDKDKELVVFITLQQSGLRTLFWKIRNHFSFLPTSVIFTYYSSVDCKSSYMFWPKLSSSGVQIVCLRKLIFYSNCLGLLFTWWWPIRLKHAVQFTIKRKMRVNINRSCNIVLWTILKVKQSAPIKLYYTTWF